MLPVKADTPPQSLAYSQRLLVILLYTSANINKIQLLDELLVTLARQCLCKTICWHIIRREPIDLNSPSLNLLPQPMLVDIDVA